MAKAIAIVGASADREKYSNKAVRAYLEKGWKVFVVNPNYSEVEGLKCFDSVLDIEEDVELASFYVKPTIGVNLVEDLKAKGIEKVYLNPGSESDELIKKLKKFGIQPILACSIKAIGVNPNKI